MSNINNQQDLRDKLDELKDELGWKDFRDVDDKGTRDALLYTLSKMMNLIDLVNKVETKRQIDNSNYKMEKLSQ